jgi:predicted metal-dependent enzyme (double-stranded beta helix superfamily)
VATANLRIQQLVPEVESGRQEWVERLQAFCQELLGSIECWQQVKQRPLPGSGYDRWVVAKEQTLEIVLITWPAGAETPRHNHGPRFHKGYVQILEGVLVNHNFRRSENGLIEHSHQLLTPGDHVMVFPETIHQMSNPSSCDTAISAHFYSPPIEDPCFFK